MEPPDESTQVRAAKLTPYSLDAVAFLVADVEGALGPYLNVFLVTQKHWSQSSVGLITTLSGLLGILFNTPAGALIDRTRAKRGFLVAALAVLGVAATVIPLLPRFWPVLLANASMSVVGDVIGPAIAAITLGLFAKERLARRLGRNAAFFHGGNIAIAALAGLVGWAWSQQAVFFLVPIFAAFAALAVLTIPAAAIDHQRARGDQARDQEAGKASASWTEIFKQRPLMIFGICAALFHFANAPLLPLVGQKLALANSTYATAMMSACIIAAQVVMLPVALAVGNTVDRIGRKPILLIAFGVLPIRAFLYPFSDHATWLIGVQLLDGIGAGIFDALTPLLLADIMRGTGRYNLAQGFVATLQGLGASLSGLSAGLIVDHFGYTTAFCMSGAVSAMALVILWLCMPETANRTPATTTSSG